QNGDNRNYHQQFDQCEAAARPGGCVLRERLRSRDECLHVTLANVGVAPGAVRIDDVGVGFPTILPFRICRLLRPSIRWRGRSNPMAFSETLFMNAECSTRRAIGERLFSDADR